MNTNTKTKTDTGTNTGTNTGTGTGAPMSTGSSSTDQDTALAAGFAYRLAQLARRTGASHDGIRWVQDAAFEASRATSNGHVCISLAAMAQRYHTSVEVIHSALCATAVVTDMTATTNTSATCHSETGGDAQHAAWRPLVIDAQQRLYLARYYACEQQLARALVAHAGMSSTRCDGQHGGVPVDELRRGLSHFFGPWQNGGVDWQRVAVALAMSGRMVIISGGPGTGKTTTVAMMIACMVHAQAAASESLRIALAAPTGKAAQRMQEALRARASDLPPEVAAQLPQTSFTLHRLLGQKQDGQCRYRRDNPLPYDVVVIDEASMIDVALAAHLFDALAPSTRLVLLGDKDQLAAVEAGAVFSELSAHLSFSPAMQARVADALGMDAALFARELQRITPSAASHDGDDRHDGHDAHEPHEPHEPHDAGEVLTDCVVWLEHNYRFGLASPVGQLATAIRRGAARQALAVLTSDTPDAAWHEDARATLNAATFAQLEAGFTPYAQALADTLAHHANPAGALRPLFDALNCFRILCAMRTGTRGVMQLNAQLGAWLRRRVQAAPVSINGRTWFAGQPVMVTCNDYALNLFNGDTGIVLPAANGALRVWFYDDEGHVRAIAPAALPSHDTAFALTVHKSQGSEFGRVALVLPAHAHGLVTRELVYTAVTRAKQGVAIYGPREVLAHAIATPTRRDSGLASRIAEALRDGGRADQ